MMNGPVIDADGHVFEKERYIRKYLESPWDKRSTPLSTRDQPWDANLFDSFEMAVRWEELSPKEQIEEWHVMMEREGMGLPFVFPPARAMFRKSKSWISLLRWRARATPILPKSLTPCPIA